MVPRLIVITLIPINFLLIAEGLISPFQFTNKTRKLSSGLSFSDDFNIHNRYWLWPSNKSREEHVLLRCWLWKIRSHKLCTSLLISSTMRVRRSTLKTCFLITLLVSSISALSLFLTVASVSGNIFASVLFSRKI